MDLMASESKRPVDWPARVIGLIVFALGVALLLLVFVWASQSLSPPTTVSNQPINFGSIGTRLAWELARLIVLALVASAIAGRGVHLYAVASRTDS
jgi:hypothetical protein